jgi:hypothetical protein
MNLSHPRDKENEIGITPADKFRNPTALELALVAAALSGAQRKPAEALLDEAKSLLDGAYIKCIEKKYPAAISVNAEEEHDSKLRSVRVLKESDFRDRKKFSNLSPIIEVTLELEGLDGETSTKTLPDLYDIKTLRKCAKRLIKLGYLSNMYDFKLSEFKKSKLEDASDFVVDGYHFDALYTARVNQLALQEWARLGEHTRPLGASFLHPILKVRTYIVFDFKQIVEGLKTEKRVTRIVKWVQRL